MLAEYVVEALDVQLRPLDRLTHLLKRSAVKVDFEDLEDIDFDTLLPLFTILARGSTDCDMESGYYSRLQTHFEHFSEFMYYLVVNISSKCALFLEFVAVTVLPVFYECIQALLNYPNIATTNLVFNLNQFLLSSDSIGFPSEESMAVIACRISIIKELSALSEPIISKQSLDFQIVCLHAVISGVIALRKCLDWSAYGGSILSDLRAFFSPLTCEIPLRLMESILDSITRAYGETAIPACRLVGVLPWRPSVANLLLATLRWMEGLVKLYIFPEGVEVTRFTGFQHRLAGTVLSTCDLLGRYNEEIAQFCKKRFERLYLLYSGNLSQIEINYFL